MRIPIAIVLLLAVFISGAPAYAFDPPEQSTDNATDIILWHGDNLTIASANLTIESANITVTGEVEVSGDVELTGFVDSMESIAADFLAFVIVAFMIIIVLAKGSVILNALGVPVALVYGFTVASEQDVYSPLWVAGVAIGLLGLYFLYQIATEAIVAAKRGVKRHG